MEVLGIDIGGSGIKGAVINSESGDFIEDRYRITTPQPATPKAIVKTVAKIAKYFSWNGYIGCGFPAAIPNGNVKNASNIDESWISVNVSKLFTEATKCETFVLNDADAAGLAEMKFGAGRNFNGVVLLITIGTGLGTALFTKGKLLPNTEFGHILLNGKIAEHYASDAVRKNENLSWKKWAKRFNEYLLRMEVLLSPDLIILGGGASKKSEKYFKHLTTCADVVPAQLLNHAGIIGAALFAELNKDNQRKKSSN
jgi:polyphosphate glucokinase